MGKRIGSSEDFSPLKKGRERRKKKEEKEKRKRRKERKKRGRNHKKRFIFLIC